VSLPREVLPGSFYMITRRCTQRQFLLKPDRVTNEIFLYCLAVAALRYEIEVILPSAMSNHHHTVVYDRLGRIIEFMEHFHKLFARAQNAHWGRWENLWSSEPPCLVRLEKPPDVMDKLVYAATNPVKDALVERVRDWPGVNGFENLLDDREFVVARPTVFFRESGTMPAEVRLSLVIPPELGEPEAVRRALRERVADTEAQYAERRRKSGTRVLGRRAILQQSWWDSPGSPEPRRGLRPRIAARSLWARVEALARNALFLTAYRAARALWLSGLEAVFPAGTYWLKRHANVPVASLATN
jgi:hypothetical protein